MFLKCRYIFSRILKNYERSEKSDTVLLDEIKERVLHEDFDGTSELSVSIVIYTGKNNGFPLLNILGYLKNTHKNPKFGKVRQVPTREFPTKFPD